MPTDEKKEELYGRIALERGLITREQLDEAWKQWTRDHRKNKKLRLGEVMMQQGDRKSVV